MVDYTKFLKQKEQSAVLPYLGGSVVHASDRRLRVQQREAVGWWRFSIAGRVATPKETVEADLEAMESRPRLRGHLVGDWLFVSGTQAHRLYLMPEEEAEPFAVATARTWHGGEHLFDGLEFEDEAELGVRDALMEDLVDLATTGIKGITPSLKAAFGWARVAKEARERSVALSLLEVMESVHEIALGTLRAPELVSRIAWERRNQQPDAETYQRRAREAASRAARRRVSGSPEDRARDALEGAGADLLATRFVGDTSMEVTFRYWGERFSAIVDTHTLHVYDSGICLDGADEMLGLDALPVVIREAAQTGQLVIMR